ncbi:MAG TPA: hypothetical protein VF345_05450 [Chthoniobacterales bacterium]
MFSPRLSSDLTMNASEKPRQSGTAMISSEAIIGIGITIAELGLLCLMLALAEHLRSVPKIALVWLALGAVLMILGGFTAAFTWFKDRRR